MNRATDPLNSVFNASVDAAQRLAALNLEESECLLRRQLDLARQLFTLTAEQFTQWSSDSASPVASRDWPTLFRASAERAGELTRNCAYVATKAQNELVRLSREQMGLLGKIWDENIHGITAVAEAAGIAGFEPAEKKHKKAA
jgi:phasin protein